MKRFIGFLLTFLLTVAFTQNVTALVLDDVTIDENITSSKNKNEKTDKVTIRFHNYPDDISDNLRLTLNQEEIFKPDYNLTADRITRYYYILIDNSGSIQERDLAAIRRNVSYLISHINKQDYVEVITVSDYSSAIYNLSHYSPNVLTRIDGIVREGNYSRLYDAVSELNTRVLAKQSKDTGKDDVIYYILFFSDGEDIDSHTTGRQMRDGYRDIPFYYFCYSSNFKPEPNKPLQDIAAKHGKFFNYLDSKKIDELFFSNENRYTLDFLINKKEVLKSKSYYIELSKRTTEEGKIIIDLRKYFDGSNLNDMIVDAPKDNTLYHNLQNNLVHDTQYAYNNSQLDDNGDKQGKSSDNRDTTVISTEAERSVNNNEQNITSTETKKSNDENKQTENSNIDDRHIRESSMNSTSVSDEIQHDDKAGEQSRTTVTENNQDNNVTRTGTEKSADNKKDNKTAAAGAAAAAALHNKSDNSKSTNDNEMLNRVQHDDDDNEMLNHVQHDNSTKKSSDSRNTTVISTEAERSKDNEMLNRVQHDNDDNEMLNHVQHDNNTTKSSGDENNTAVSDEEDSSDDNAAAVIIPAKADKHQKQAKQNKTVKEKTEKTKETKEKTKRDNKWLLWLLIILLLLLLLLLLIWLIWWLIRKISDSNRAASSGGGRSSGGIDRTPVETYSPPPTPIVSSSSSSAKKPAAKPAANNKVKFRIAKDSYRKAKNRIDNTKESGIPTFIEEMNKDEGKFKVGSAVTISEILDDHISAQSMTSLQPDDIVTINKADFRVIYVRYRSKVYTFTLVPIDPNYDIRRNVKMTDSVTMAEKTVAVYGSKEAIINKMLVPSKVEIVSPKWSDGTIDTVIGQTDKVIRSDSPLYLDYIVEIQQGAKSTQYLITEVKYENRKYTGKIKPL